MLTDPVTAPISNCAKVIYGALFGFLLVFLRTFNFTFPESVMFLILFMNVLSPTIDEVVVSYHKKSRRKHNVK